MYLSSAKSCNLSRQFFPIPSYQMLYHKFGDTIRNEKKKRFKVYYKSTDGDKYLSNEHEVFYLSYIEGKSENFLELVKDVELKTFIK